MSASKRNFVSPNDIRKQILFLFNKISHARKMYAYLKYYKLHDVIFLMNLLYYRFKLRSESNQTWPSDDNNYHNQIYFNRNVGVVWKNMS